MPEENKIYSHNSCNYGYGKDDTKPGFPICKLYSRSGLLGRDSLLSQVKFSKQASCKRFLPVSSRHGK